MGGYAVTRCRPVRIAPEIELWPLNRRRAQRWQEVHVGNVHFVEQLLQRLVAPVNCDTQGWLGEEVLVDHLLGWHDEYDELNAVPGRRRAAVRERRAE